MFRTIYQSPWLHPGLAFLLGGVGILIVVALRPFQAREKRRAWALLFSLLQAEILLDAALTGALSPFAADSPAASLAPLVFVILGDLRYFYLVERQCQDLEGSRFFALLAAFALSTGVPLLTGIERLLFPHFFVENRLFLSYELTFLFLIVIHFVLRGTRSAQAVYVRRLFMFEFVQYLLWASADLLILCGVDAGFALRIVPNVCYYVGFAPFAILAAPKEARA